MSLNKILGIISLTLALLAAVVGTPHGNETDLTFIAHLIDTGQDHITARELADQLFHGKKIRLIDLRDSALYAMQHIPDAERMSLEMLLKVKLRRDEVTVLYSEGGIHALQAWTLLKMKHIDSVYILLGGFAAWREEVLYPVLPDDATTQARIENERRRALSVFFGGAPQSDVAKPAQSPSGLRKHPKRKSVSPKEPDRSHVSYRFHC